MIIDILNFMVAVATVFLAYRFFIERSKGKKIAFPLERSIKNL